MSSYSDHVSNPLSVISYNVGGTRTYVTRIEERIQEVRKPTVAGYVYSSTMKVVPAKQSRPPEFDGFFNQILNEVNGPSSTTTRTSSRPAWDFHDSSEMRDYGANQKFGPNSSGTVIPMRYYDYTNDNIQVGSHEKEFQLAYGDPYRHQWSRSSARGGEQSPPKDYRVPNNQPYSQSKKQEVVADYKYPKSDYVFEPQSMRDEDEAPNNRRDYSNMKPKLHEGYEEPNSRWIKTSLEPQLPRGYEDQTSRWATKPHSPRDYEDPNNQYRTLNPISHQFSPNDNNGVMNQRENPLKSQSHRDYYHPEIKQTTPSNTISSPYQPDNHDDKIPYTQQNKYSLKPLSQNGSRNPAINLGMRNNPNYDQQAPNNNNHLGNSSREPNHPKGNFEMESQSPKGYRDSNNPFSQSTSPISHHLSPSRSNDRLLNNKWNNSPLKPPQSSRGYGIPGTSWNGSPNPINDQQQPDGSVPGIHNGNSSLKPSEPRAEGHGNQQYIYPNLNHDQIQPYDHKDVVPNSKGSNSDIKPQSPKNLHNLGNHWGMSSSPLSGKQPSNNQWGNSPMKAPNPQDHISLNHPEGSSPTHVTDNPLSKKNVSKASKNPQVQASPQHGKVSDNTNSVIRKSKYVAETLPDGRTEKYSTPANLSGIQLKDASSSQRKPIINGKEGQRFHGSMNIPSNKYQDGKGDNMVITSKDVVERYNGFLI